jgi:type VI secretion system protein ImpK
MTTKDDDPFASFDGDRTILVPSPGGRSAPQTHFVPHAAGAEPGVPPATEFDASSVGLNPLVAAANPLLDIVPQLRATLQHPDPLGLRDSLARDIKEFERRAQVAQVPHDKIIAARYALCTLLDEVAASTPWGSVGVWAKANLLVTFHNEVSGGEKFFHLLSKLAEKPAANLDLLELMYVCLALGFEGRYRLVENGRQQLDGIRERLAQLIREQRGEYERDLSPRWQGAANRRYAPLRAIPIWAVGALCGLLLLTAYFGFRYLLNADSDPVFARIHAIRADVPKPPPPPPPPPKVEPPRLAPFLANEISNKLVAVDDQATRSVVTILGDRLFAPGSASVSPELEPVILRIGEALQAVPGQVVVTGHTDNQSIRSLRFHSNWQLSEERARSVVQLLAQKVTPPSRLTAEGSGDTSPIASNDTAEGRARNRRVEIVLTFGPPRT